MQLYCKVSNAAVWWGVKCSCIVSYIKCNCLVLYQKQLLYCIIFIVTNKHVAQGGHNASRPTNTILKAEQFSLQVTWHHLNELRQEVIEFIMRQFLQSTNSLASHKRIGITVRKVMTVNKYLSVLYHNIIGASRKLTINCCSAILKRWERPVTWQQTLPLGSKCHTTNWYLHIT